MNEQTNQDPIDFKSKQWWLESLALYRDERTDEIYRTTFPRVTIAHLVMNTLVGGWLAWQQHWSAIPMLASVAIVVLWLGYLRRTVDLNDEFGRYTVGRQTFFTATLLTLPPLIFLIPAISTPFNFFAWYGIAFLPRLAAIPHFARKRMMTNSNLVGFLILVIAGFLFGVMIGVAFGWLQLNDIISAGQITLIQSIAAVIGIVILLGQTVWWYRQRKW